LFKKLFIVYTTYAAGWASDMLLAT